MFQRSALGGSPRRAERRFEQRQLDQDYFFSNARRDTFVADDDLEPPHRAGRLYIGCASSPDPGEPEEGAVRAVDPATGTTRWEFRQFSGAWAGVIATAGGLVFTGDGQGNFIALDAESGRDLWHVPLGAGIRTAAISYAVDGRQFVTITAGDAIFTFALPQAAPRRAPGGARHD